MSIKTLRKRIALVAVSAMGFGLLTTTAANAASGAVTFDKDSVVCAAFKGTAAVDANNTDVDGSATTVDTTSTTTLTASSGAITVYAPIGGTVILNSDDADDFVTTTSAYATVATTGTVALYPLQGVWESTDNNGGHVTTITPTSAGTISVKGYTATSINTTNAPVWAVTIVATASCSTSTFSAADSYVVTNTSVALAAANNDVTTTASAGGTLYINVVANSALGLPVGNGTWIATSTNGAKVKIATTAAPLSSAILTPFDSLSNTNGTQITVAVKAPVSGTAASTVVTLTYNGTVITSKTLTFLGEATKINLVAQTVGKVGDEGMIWYTLSDAAGNAVPGAVDIDPFTLGARVNGQTAARSTTLDSVSAGTTPGGTISGIPYSALGSGKYGIIEFNCASTAGTGTAAVTLRHYQAISDSYLTLPVTLSCAGGTSTFTLSMDKASYKVGEVGVLTVSAKDSTGAAVNDFTLLNSLTAAPVISAGGASVVDAAAADVFGILNGLATGTKTYRLQMTTAGAFNAVVNLGGKAQTVGYTVTADGVSNAEVLAAIVKLIASINEQIALLQKQLKKMSAKK